MDKREQLYKLYRESGLLSDAISLEQFMSADSKQQEQLYKIGKQNGLIQSTDITTFQSAWGPSKKKEASVLPSDQEPISSVTPEMEAQEPLASSQKPKIKTPSRANPNIDQDDYNRFFRTSRELYDAIDKGDKQTVSDRLKELNQIYTMYGDVAKSDKNMSDDYNTVLKIASSKFDGLNTSTFNITPTREKTGSEIAIESIGKEKVRDLPQNVKSDIKLTDEENKAIEQSWNIMFDEQGNYKVDLNEVEQELDDEFSGGGIWDDFVRTIRFSASQYPLLSKQIAELKTQKEKSIAKVALDLKAKGIDPLSEEGIQYAKDVRRQELIDQKEYEIVEDYYEDQSLIFKTDEQKQTEKGLESIKNKYALHAKEFDKKQKELSSTGSVIEGYVTKLKNKEPLSDLDIQDLQSNFIKFNIIASEIKDNYSNIENDISGVGAFEQELDRFKRNHANLTNAGASVAKFSLDLVGGLSSIIGMEQEMVKGVYGVEMYNPFLEFGEFAKTASESISDSVSRAKQLDNVNSASEAAEWMGRLMVDQAPQLLMAYFTGGASIGLMGASAAGNKYLEVKDNESYNDLQKYIASFGIGAAEALSEKIELDVISSMFPSKRLAKAAIGKEGKEAFDAAMKSGIRKQVEATASKISNINKEGVSELVAQLGNNLVDRFVLGNKDVSLLDGVGEAYLSGAVIGGAMSVSPAIASKVLAPFVNDPQSDIRKNLSKIKELQDAYEFATKKEDKEFISGKIQKIKDKNAEIIQRGINSLNNLTPEEIKEGVSIVESIIDLKSKYRSIKENNTIPESAKDVLLSEIDEEYNALVERKKQLIDKAYAVQEQTTGEVPVQPEATIGQEMEEGKPQPEPQAAAQKGQEEITSKSTDDLEKRLYDIEDSPDDLDEYIAIEKELESREWKSVINSSLDKVSKILDTLEKKDREMPNGFGTFIEPSDIRQSRKVVEKYSSDVSKQEAKKDFKDAFFGNPSTFYADALKLRESARAYVEQGGSMKELLSSISSEFENDGFTEQDAASIINTKLNAVKSRLVDEATTEPQVITEEGKEEKITPEQYVKDLKDTKESDPGQYWSVDDVSLEAAKEGTIVGDQDGSAVVGKDGDIKGLFKNFKSKAKGVADILLKKAVEVGGIKLDNFDNYLSKIYKRNGFRVVSRIPFNEEYAPEGWTKDKGTPDVVAMVYDPNNELDIEERTFEDYDEAIAYRDSYVEQAKNNLEQQQALAEEQGTSTTIEGSKLRENIQKAVSKVFKSFNTRNFKSGKAMANYAKKKYGTTITTSEGARVFFDDQGNVEILVNESLADDTSFGHEVWHPILVMEFGDNQEMFKDFRDGINKILRDNGFEDIADELDAFADQYKDNEVPSEEYLAQLGGMLTSGRIDAANLAPQEKSLLDQIKDIINAFAERITGQPVFLKDATPETILSFMATMSDMMTKGEDISGMVSSSIKPDIVVENTSELFSSRPQKMGNFEILYFEDEKDFKKLEDDGYIVQNSSLSNIPNEKVAIHQPDNLLVGNVMYNGKKIMDGNGGVYYVLKFGNVWASGKQNSAKSLANLINKSLKESTDGKARLVLVRGSQDKMISSVQGVKAGMEILEQLMFDNLISKNDFRKALNIAGKKYGIDFSGSSSAESIKKDITDKFMNVEDSTFARRGDFFSDLISEIGKLPSSKENIEKIREALGAEKKISFSVQGIRQQIGTILTERLLLNLPSSHAYAYIEVDEEVVVIKDNKHESYPWAIVTKSGKRPVLHILNERQKATDAIAREDGSPASNAQLGLAQRGMGFGMIKSRPQKIKTEATTDDFVLPFGKYKGQWMTTTPPAYRNWLAQQYWYNPKDYMLTEEEANEKFGTEDGEANFKSRAQKTNVKEVRQLSSELKSLDDENLESLKSLINKDSKEPKKTQKAYKLFKVKKGFPGELFPLFVGADTSVTTGDWIDAKAGELKKDKKTGKQMVKSTLGPLAYRPGWHAGDSPMATHIGSKANKSDKKPTFRSENHVWAEVEVSNDVDWQKVANERATKTKDGRINVGTAHITDQVPLGGFYRYKTNPNMTGNWIISGNMKVNRVLSEKEVKDLNKKMGTEDLPRKEEFDYEGYGFGKDGLPLDKKKVVSNQIARAYIVAKETGENPELVEAVESSAGIKTRAQKVNLDGVKGYERVKNNIDGIIEKKKAKNKNVTKEQLLDATMPYLQESLAYQNATDVQREQMVRDLRKKLGLRQKSAPRVDRLLGFVENVNKITVDEKKALIDVIKRQAMAAKGAVKAYRDVAKTLIKEIKDLQTTGKITVRQMTAALRKFESTDMLNPESVSKFIDYISKVFDNAEYYERISSLKRKRLAARKNAAKKLGIASEIRPLLDAVLAVDPSMVPDSVLDTYEEMINMLSERAKVLSLQEIDAVKKNFQEIDAAIREQESLVSELALALEEYEGKIYDDSGKLDFAATVAKMEQEGLIDSNGVELLKKYKSTIVERQSTKKTEQELKEEKDALIELLLSSDAFPERLSSRSERDKAKQIAKIAKNKDVLELLNNSQLSDLFKVIDNINNGYLPHSAQIIYEIANSRKKFLDVIPKVEKAKVLPYEKVVSGIKSLFMYKQNTSYQVEAVRRNPLIYIDQIYGNFKGTEIFDAYLDDMSRANSRYTSEINEANGILDDAEIKLFNKLKRNPNKLVKSKFKMMAYLIQKEHESNPDNKETRPTAVEFIDETIALANRGKIMYGDREVSILEEIKKEFSENGEISTEKIENSFIAEEKNAIKAIRKVNQSMADKAVYTAGVIRGENIKPRVDYIHLHVIGTRSSKPTDDIKLSSQASDMMRPSTRGKSLIERKGVASAVDFDPFNATARGAKFVLLDFHMTEPVRTVRRLINYMDNNIDKYGKDAIKISNAINKIVEESISNVLLSDFETTSFLDDALNYLQKSGYRSMLAGIPRATSELLSNMSYVIATDPAVLTEWTKYTDIMNNTVGLDVMRNVRSKQIERIYPSHTLSGRMIDTSSINNSIGLKESKSRNEIVNAMNIIYNYSLKPGANAIELAADALISTPDKIIMRPIWFVNFGREFEKVSGTKPDFNKISENDEAYMAKYKEAIKKASAIADDSSIKAGASDNAFTGILKSRVKATDTSMLKFYKRFNNFMQRFLNYEYSTARTGAYALMGNGMISRAQGAKLLAGTMARMTSYTLLSGMIGKAFYSLFSPEEEDEDTLMQEVGQATVSSLVNIILGKNLGNVPRSLMNIPVELTNENYFDFLRTGDYDPYDDAIAYTIVPKDKKAYQDAGVWDYVENMSGAYSPALKAADFGIKYLTKEFLKENKDIKTDMLGRPIGMKDSQISRMKRHELEKWRVMGEILGNMGYIPLYKDVRKIGLNYLYEDLKKKKEVKTDLLGRPINPSK